MARFTAPAASAIDVRFVAMPALLERAAPAPAAQFNPIRAKLQNAIRDTNVSTYTSPAMMSQGKQKPASVIQQC
jgi:hypothetical protein